MPGPLGNKSGRADFLDIDTAYSMDEIMSPIVVQGNLRGPRNGDVFSTSPIPRKYGDPVGPTPVSPRPRKPPSP